MNTIRVRMVFLLLLISIPFYKVSLLYYMRVFTGNAGSIKIAQYKALEGFILMIEILNIT